MVCILKSVQPSVCPAPPASPTSTAVQFEYFAISLDRNSVMLTVSIADQGSREPLFRVTFGYKPS